MKHLRMFGRAVVSDQGAQVVKYLMVLALCGLMLVALVDAANGRFHPAPAAFTSAGR